MSLTPIFDAVLADSEPDIFLASPVFPRPQFARGGLVPNPYDDRLDSILYSFYSFAAMDPRYRAKVTGQFPIRGDSAA